MNVQVSNMSWGFTKAYSILPFYAYIQYIKSSQFNTVRHVVKCTLVQYPEGFDSDLTLHFLRLGLTPNLLSVCVKFIGLIHKIQIRTICTL